MRKIVFLAFLTVVAACSTTALTPEGAMVRAVDADWANECEFLGVVESHHTSGLDAGADRLGAMNDTRNKVAAMGGNAFTVSSSTALFDSHLVQADAYACSQR